MGRIKSAWEIALEKTEGMEIDQEKIRHNSEIDRIRRTAGHFISADEGEENEEDLRKELSASEPSLVREALTGTIINSMVLPQEKESAEKKTARIRTLLQIAFPSEDILSYYDQISQHLSQYPEHREKLMEQLKAQIEPMLKEKEEAMREKYGQAVHLTIENDKESLEMVRNYLDRLTGQYQGTLDDAKERMKSLLEELQVRKDKRLP